MLRVGGACAFTFACKHSVLKSRQASERQPILSTVKYLERESGVLLFFFEIASNTGGFILAVFKPTSKRALCCAACVEMLCLAN